MSAKKADAIHRLGECSPLGEPHRAKRLFKMLTTIRPDLYSPGFVCAVLRGARQYLEAANSYREVTSWHPKCPTAFTGLRGIV